jgi:hypothetical protein
LARRSGSAAVDARRVFNSQRAAALAATPSIRVGSERVPLHTLRLSTNNSCEQRCIGVLSSVRASGFSSGPLASSCSAAQLVPVLRRSAATVVRAQCSSACRVALRATRRVCACAAHNRAVNSALPQLALSQLPPHHLLAVARKDRYSGCACHPLHLPFCCALPLALRRALALPLALALFLSLPLSPPPPHPPSHPTYPLPLSLLPFSISLILNRLHQMRRNDDDRPVDARLFLQLILVAVTLSSVSVLLVPSLSNIVRTLFCYYRFCHRRVHCSLPLHLSLNTIQALLIKSH